MPLSDKATIRVSRSFHTELKEDKNEGETFECYFKRKLNELDELKKKQANL